MGHPWVVDVKGLAEKFNLKYFVETGTFSGDTVEYALSLDCFDKVFSVEIEPEIYQFTSQRFAGNDKVSLFLGNSYDVLEKEILPQLDAPAFFWLDAHFPGADIGLNGKTYTTEKDKNVNCPLEKEIEVITQSPFYALDSDKVKVNPDENVILIDDAWLYTKQEIDPFNPDTKTIDDHFKNIGQPEANRDSLLGDGWNDEFIYHNFRNHQIGLITSNTGYYLITPFGKILNPDHR